MYRSFTS